MIRCLTCGAVGQECVRSASSPDTVTTWPACSTCNSDMVEEVAACVTCKQQPAACDDECVACVVTAIRTMPEEFDFRAAFWRQPGWSEAAARAGRVTA